jgi:hypothetical protein
MYSDRLRAGRLGFHSWQGKKILSSAERPGRLRGPGSYEIDEGSSSGVKRTDREADSSLPSCSKVNNSGAMPPLPHTSSWRDA